MKTYSIDPYVIDVLMPDLVGHDRSPAAFLVYLSLYCTSERRRNPSVPISLQELATQTGLAKSTIQVAIRHLKRRHLLDPAVIASTTKPARRVAKPWAR
ncbi:MAG: helix-turn-helix domain-containing protein [Dokdonella sp.]